MPPPHLERLLNRGKNLVGVWNNVLVSVWRDPPTIDDLRFAEKVERELEQRYPDGFVTMIILPTSTGPFPTELREEARRISASHSKRLRAIAEVIESRGFAGAAVRSVAAGMALLTPGDIPIKVFSGVEPAAAWLATFLGKEVRPTAPRLLAEAIRSSSA
jgi:hypothetical protein